MSLKALTWAFGQDVGDPYAKLILLALADHHNESYDLCCPRKALLAKAANCDARTVIRKIKLLVEGGWISCEERYEKGRQISNCYRLNMSKSDGDTESPPGDTADTPGGDTAVTGNEPEKRTGRKSAHMRASEGKQVARASQDDRAPRAERSRDGNCGDKPPGCVTDLIRRAARKPLAPRRYRASQEDMELYRQMAEGVG